MQSLDQTALWICKSMVGIDNQDFCEENNVKMTLYIVELILDLKRKFAVIQLFAKNKNFTRNFIIRYEYIFILMVIVYIYTS